MSTDAGAFNKKIVKQMLEYTKRPIIFPLSNPNSKSEADPKDLFKWTDGQALVATGSPYEPTELKGEIYTSYQCNNVYVFPSIGLACATVPIKEVTQNMFIAAAETLSENALPDLYPSFKQLREVTMLMAQNVIKVAQAENLIEQMPTQALEYLLEENMYKPIYKPYCPE